MSRGLHPLQRMTPMSVTIPAFDGSTRLLFVRLAGVAERQTLLPQKQLPFGACGFDSHLRH